MSAEIILGTHTVPIVAQSHARLRHELPRVISAEQLEQIAENTTDDEAAGLGRQIAGFTDKAYEILVVLAPRLGEVMPKYEFQGYASAEAMTRDEYDPAAAAKAPSLPQLVDAFDTALEVNGIKRLGELISTARLGQSVLGGAGRPPASARPTTRTSPDSLTSTTA